LYKKINIALIGFGYWGKKVFKYLKNRKDINIKYIYTRKKINIKNNTQNLKLIKDDITIKKVFLITPIDTHYKLAKFFNNKILFIEKPLTLEYKNSLKILKNRNIFVDYLYRYSQAIIRLKKITDNKSLGKLKNLNINISQTGRFNKFDVNYLLNSHALSIISIFTDIKTSKFLINPNLFNKGNVTDLNINFINNSLKGNIFLSLNSIFKKFNITLIFENGTVELFKFKTFSKLNISKYKRNSKLKIKSLEISANESDNLNKSINVFLSKKFNFNMKENIKIAYILEKIEKIIYKRKKFLDYK
tara:strand:- start:678 stop:1586 length:909 start_codon:yes stop_codon:yes gene_type:complete